MNGHALIWNGERLVDSWSQTWPSTTIPTPVEEWEEEEVTIIKRRRKISKPDVVTTITSDTPCAFDGLPDGAYLLYCPCPRHGSLC